MSRNRTLFWLRWLSVVSIVFPLSSNAEEQDGENSLSKLDCVDPAWNSPLWSPPNKKELAEAKLACQPYPYGEILESENNPSWLADQKMFSTGAEDGSRSVSYTIENPLVGHECAVWRDPCTGYANIAGGTTWGVIGTDATGSDNWWDGGTDDCASGAFAGYTLDGDDLRIYIQDGYGYDVSSSAGGCVQMYLYVSEYDSDDCTGTLLRGSYYDNVEWSSNTTPKGYSRAYCDDLADCDGSEGDSCDSDWHMLDVIFTDNFASYSEVSYSVRTYSRVCNYDCSTGCTAWNSDTDGCFYVGRL